MIQDIEPEKLDMTFKRQPPVPGDIVVALQGNKVLMLDEGARLPRASEFAKMFPDAARGLVYLFTISDTGFHYCDFALDVPDGWCLKDLMTFRGHQPGWEAFGGVTASHIGLWYAANRFCGACGSRMRHKEDERAMRCAQCGALVYPRISPAVIVGVLDGDRILLTRYANRPNSQLTALIAGFIEIGETLEEAVRREVLEEVGVSVKNIRYYKSQPWSFSGSVLVGFYADLDGSPEITLDRNELQEAKWFTREELPCNENPPSLTATMVEAFRSGAVG